LQGSRCACSVLGFGGNPDGGAYHQASARATKFCKKWEPRVTLQGAEFVAANCLTKAVFFQLSLFVMRKTANNCALVYRAVASAMGAMIMGEQSNQINLTVSVN
jgi:hypothetical protein